MDKNRIKKFAVWARIELITKVRQRAALYGITDTEIIDENAENINGNIITGTEKKQRQALIAKIKKEGFEQVMEEVAYTWFNRFVAIRYMEVNGYLPGRVRVFTDQNGVFKPEILSEAIHLELDGLDMGKVYALKDANDDEALYKYLFVVQCNALSANLPYMFARIEDYTELLLPDYLLREGSVIEQMINQIAEEDWTDQVQIIGWLYQYYNTEKKDEVFAALKKNVKITKENIPAATQLFTPDWIVRYMVENSLGRLWTEGHPDADLKAGWKYYLEETEQEPEVEAELARIRAEHAGLNPEDIKVMDPCMGSGHILVYAFEVLMQIYESAGYTQRDATELILEKNLYGLDIDDRAGQLAYFAVMMMARKYHRRILSKGITPNVMAIQDSSNMHENTITFIAEDNDRIKNDLLTIKTVLADAKEYGSILTVPEVDFDGIYAAIIACQDREGDMLAEMEKKNAVSIVMPIVKQAQIMAEKYDVCVTNPPYMGRKSLTAKLSEFIEVNYKNGKSELYSTFISKCSNFTKQNGYTAMVTMHTWMFISTFKNLRKDILRNETITSMVHSGPATFEELNSFNVLATAFVRMQNHLTSYKGEYLRLTDYYDGQEKMNHYHDTACRYEISQSKFFFIEEQPIIYWLSDETYEIFRSGKKISDYGQLTNGLFTCDNARFVRLWFEVSAEKIGFNINSVENAKASRKKWFPYGKGGNYRKWYGNNEYIVNYENNGDEIRQYRIKQGQSKKFPGEAFYFQPGITWAPFGFENFGVRYKYCGDIFDIAGSSLFTYDKTNEMYILAFLASKVGFYFLSTLAPTVNFQIGNIANLPMLIESASLDLISTIAHENIQLSIEEWDDYETSWNFKYHPWVKGKSSQLSVIYENWCIHSEKRYLAVKHNEEKINAEFIRIYGLAGCVDAEVIDRDLSLRKADKVVDVKSFLSYAVGCMLGRYSLDVDGLAYAGGQWDDSRYSTFLPDADNIIPICDDEYFDDDMVSRFVDFVKAVYGEETLEENLKFIADALGGKGTAREVIRNYFLKDFFKDHCKTYQKRPVYWLFDSGKKNGLKCLIYMHRYQPETIARIRTDYVHEQQSRYHTAIEEIEARMNGIKQSERVKLNKKLKKLHDQADELRVYEEKIHHLADQMISIDFDDGVKVNYAKFQDVLAKIK